MATGQLLGWLGGGVTKIVCTKGICYVVNKIIKIQCQTSKNFGGGGPGGSQDLGLGVQFFSGG
jgi:hypothetical protein